MEKLSKYVGISVLWIFAFIFLALCRAWFMYFGYNTFCHDVLGLQEITNWWQAIGLSFLLSTFTKINVNNPNDK